MPGRYNLTASSSNYARGTRPVHTIVAPSKRHNTLNKTFNCVFCPSQNTVRVSIDRKNKLGRLCCSSCNKRFSCEVLYIENQVDVYSKWLDACEEVNKEETESEEQKREEEEERRKKEENASKKRKASQDMEREIRDVAKRYRVGS